MFANFTILISRLLEIFSYADGLISALDSGSYDEISNAALYSSLIEIRDFTKSSLSTGDKEIKAHYKYINWKINSYLED